MAIEIRHLSKMYRIGGENAPYETMQETLLKRLRNPLGKPNVKEFWALKDVSFNVKRGDVVGIIGRNGAGKSTLLKVLSRITRPTKGEVVLRGRVGSLLEVGTGFHPELTGRENIYLNGSILGMKHQEIQRQFDSIVEFAEVAQFLDTPVKRYSSGMYVRLAFAVAAHLNPEILIVDEVLAVGDAQFQKKCLGKMGEVARGGRTILFVSHNMAAVNALCTRAVLMRSGVLLEDGTPAEITEHYHAEGKDASASIFTKSDGYIRRVSATNGAGEPTNLFVYGDTLRLCIEMDAGDKLCTAPEVGIGVDTSLGQRMFTVGTYFSQQPLPDFRGRVQIVCEVPGLNLAPGTYLIKVALSSGTRANHIDVVNEAISFDIEPTDVFGVGKLPLATQGNIIMMAKWALTEQKPVAEALTV
jgi:lipopolysaccharide transport system ATP-binding protein